MLSKKLIIKTDLAVFDFKKHLTIKQLSHVASCNNYLFPIFHSAVCDNNYLLRKHWAALSNIKMHFDDKLLHYVMQINGRQAYSEPCQTFKMGCFENIVNGFQPLTLFSKHSILDVCRILNTLFSELLKFLLGHLRLEIW